MNHYYNSFALRVGKMHIPNLTRVWCVHFFQLKLMKKNLKFVSINIRSLLGNFYLLNSYLALNNDIDVVLLQECWQINECLKLRLNNYDGPFLKLRKNSKGGGVGIYTKNSLNAKILDTIFVESEIETIGVEIKLENETKTIVNCYRPPKNNNRAIEILNELFNSNKGCIFVGDININTLSDNNLSNDYKNLLKENGLHNKIDTPTRLASNSCLDHVLITKEITNQVECRVSNEAMSDHQVIEIVILDKCTHKQKMKSYRKLDMVALMKIKQNLTGVNIDVDNIDEKYEQLINIIKTEIDRAAPEKLKNVNRRFVPQNEWMTREILCKRRRLQNLTTKVRKGRDDLLQQLNELKKSYKRDILNSKNSFFMSKLEHFKNDSKETWRILNEALLRKDNIVSIEKIKIDNEVYENPKQLANIFVEHFTNAATSLRPVNFNTENHKPYLPLRTTEWDFHELNENDLKKIIQELKPKNGTGYDEISNKIIKNCLADSTNILLQIINTSMSESVFPEKMKVAKILPLHKKGNREMLDNYRPISLLPTLSKLLEKAVAKQINSALDLYRVIPDNQFGFKKATSTIHANIKILNTIVKAKRENKYVAVILIDVKKAFDSCSHEIILSKLKNAGASNRVVNWVKSYLNNRRQHVKLDNEISKEMIVSLGVGQGTCLGPLLFKLYLYDLPLCTELITILFADDTSAIAIADSFNELEMLCNTELNKISEWFTANGLTLHPEKTKIMLFNKQRDMNVKLNGVKVKQCGSKYNEKYINILGIHWDDKLRWNEHIKKITAKISSSLYLMRKFKNLMNPITKKLIYESLIRSHILYGIELWGNAGSNLMSKLSRLQKKAIRLIENKVHTEPVMKKYKILKIEDEYKVSTKLLAWASVRNLIPLAIKNDFIWHIQQRDGMRNNNRVTELLYRSNVLKNQLFQKVSYEINRIDTIHQNFSKRKYKNLIRKEILTNYSANVNCININCRDCNANP